ncbi:DUF3179 domain-containing protein [bacterium]|nr:DUF3179 domain-containing protein [bacterium]
MRRSTIGIGLLFLLGAALVLWGMYWFYRMPPQPKGVASGTIAESDLVSSGTLENGIPSIDTPAFETVAAADQYLKNDGEGVSVTVGRTHRFYPYQILVWHEIVNDTFGDEAVAVTYDPLTGTAIAFRRTVDGHAHSFETSGLLWNDNLVMKDRETGSLWSQLLGTTLDGAKTLDRIPATVMTWATWRQTYPSGEVLSRETGSTRDYTRDPYGNYATSPAVLFPLTHVDARLTAKTRVFGLIVGSTVATYPFDVIAQMKEIRETVGGVPLEVAYDEDTESVSAYRLNIAGERDEEIAVFPSYWFAISAAFPNLQLYQLP